MNVLKLLWSFLTRSREWLDLFEEVKGLNRIWIPQRDEEVELQISREEPRKHRSMWGN